MGAGYDVLFDSYFPFRLYSEQARGASIAELANRYGVSSAWIQERTEAARLCFEMQVRVRRDELPACGRG